MVYGLSEMSLVSMSGKQDSVDQLSNTVGIPANCANVVIKNVDTSQVCTSGELGEIVCSGPLLMIGYYKVPTDQQGLDVDGGFHTGDIGYLDENGRLHLVDRQKNLIIRGGENIFPNHIAKVVLAYDLIANAQILGIPDDYYGEIVGCAIILRSGADFDEAVFRTYLNNRLAVHEVPAFIAVYDQFPLLANGKVDVLTLRQDMQRKRNAKLGG
jgi:fatty-acyl-CoA synthase